MSRSTAVVGPCLGAALAVLQAWVAQSVEQRTRNAQVVGSNPTSGSSSPGQMGTFVVRISSSAFCPNISPKGRRAGGSNQGGSIFEFHIGSVVLERPGGPEGKRKGTTTEVHEENPGLRQEVERLTVERDLLNQELPSGLCEGAVPVNRDTPGVASPPQTASSAWCQKHRLSSHGLLSPGPITCTRSWWLRHGHGHRHQVVPSTQHQPVRLTGKARCPASTGVGRHAGARHVRP